MHSSKGALTRERAHVRSVYLFHHFDKNDDEELQMLEASKALGYLNKDARVPVKRAFQLVKGIAMLNSGGDDCTIDLTEFRILYATVLGMGKR